ncbi:MAG: hypothetical protein KKE83_03510 [Proteobacteria bacterium]|nr:hypothetical protein [Pseudomonadota bacterium]MBU1449220.1 hypothetical protein [Patescibacteria group bacterium]MBU2618733.1 hypothetical protein [Pseudomonadota bacterium]
MQTLFEHLRAQGEEKVRAVWEQAEAEVQRHTAEAETALAEERRRCRLEGEHALQELGRRLMREAEEQAWLLRAKAETALAGRLYDLARAELPWLRTHCGDTLLPALAAELPQGDWGLVRVSENEIAQARALFPTALVEGDPRLAGGLVAQSADGKISVFNTLEKRLERAWPRLLPEFFRSLHQEKPHAAS